ncbi:MAG: flagellar basal body-associated FliL family protein [Opitutaceae bacterium]|jgi:flagellar FliL protein
MPPKPESTPAPAPAPATPAPAPAVAPAASSGSKFSALIPVILVVVLAPVVSWAVAQFVIIPKMEQRLTAAVGKAGVTTAEAPAEEAAPAEESSAHGGGHGAAPKKGEASSPSNSYEFSNVVVNLAGTMGTRYLKATFLVTGKDRNIRDTFNKEKAKMVDVTLNVLSSLSLADLEEAGAKNIIREKLVNAYNQALGKKIVEQIYFSDFVVQ